ncbi:hypothetical protein GON26_06050 [Flavobacterium sp. GA093]|uniref:Phosphoribosylpyrophosphate synthetase n=1 Tax=Flavobacterium hydrocarbonoxydans TaxID=2683249 RepID=A0A6I4NHH4_9FLAO|nr:hypothetical protein [Flavobacterium hydrocarbonoxydans]MWB93916.1 hypothetical protein [Flavobacterium hydrocarbonoxydans]
MKREISKNEMDYIEEYQKNGYTCNFMFEGGCLLDTETKYAYQPDEIFIVAHHRYEGMSDPDDMSILYVIRTADNQLGTYLLGYGPMAALEEAEFFKNIPEENYSKNSDIQKLT